MERLALRETQYQQSTELDTALNPPPATGRGNNPFIAASETEKSDSPLAWQDDALCAQTSPEAFVIDKGGSTKDAKKICAQCEVRPQCLDYALENDERFGVWGGLSEHERRKLKGQVGRAMLEA